MTDTALARYFVIQCDDAWLVTLEGRIMARCATRTEAIETAAVMADLMGAMHHDADVMAEMEEGSPLELVWSYGADEPPQAHRRESDAPPHHVRLVQRGRTRPKAAARG